jgi:REP element-mobilizing transposase RayT
MTNEDLNKPVTILMLRQAIARMQEQINQSIDELNVELARVDILIRNTRLSGDSRMHTRVLNSQRRLQFHKNILVQEYSRLDELKLLP